MEDITKKGRLTYKELQKEINEPYVPMTKAQKIEATTYVPTIDNSIPKPVYSELFSENDYWGKSRHDNKVATGAEFYQNLRDTRSGNQSTVNKLLSGTGKMIALAGTTFADGTIGTLYGLGASAIALANGEKGWYAKFWDNDVSNFLQEVNNKMEEILPNYTKEWEDNALWYQRFGSADFWADSIIKNAGFTVGAYLSGNMWTKTLKTLGVVTRSIPQQITGSFLSAVNEGRIEANNNSDDWERLQTTALYDNYRKAVAQRPDKKEELDAILDKQLEEIKVKKDKMGGVDFVANVPLLFGTNFLTYRKLYSRGYRTAREKAKALGIKKSKGAVWDEAAKAQAQQQASESFGKRLVKNADGSLSWKDIPKWQAGVNAARIGVREGNEEMSQAFFSEFAGNLYAPDSPDAYYEAFIHPNAEEKGNEFFQAAWEAFKDTYGDAARYEEFFAGAMMGILGMTTFGKQANSSSQTWAGKGKFFGMSGGAIGEFTEINQLNKEGKEAVDYVNRYMQKYKDGKVSFTKQQIFSEAMEAWANEGNAFEYKNSEDNDTAQAIISYLKLGRLDMLKEIINQDFENISDEKLADIAMYMSTTVEDENGNITKKLGWRDADGNLLAERDEEGNIRITDENREFMKKELTAKREKLLSQLNSYVESVDKVQSLTGSEFGTSEAVSELAWLDWKIKRFQERYNEMQTENTPAFTSLKNSLQEYKKVYEEQLVELQKNENQPEYKEAIKQVQKAVNNVTGLIEIFDLASQNKNILDVARNVKANKEIFENLRTEESYNKIADASNLDYATYKQAMLNLLDMTKLASAAESFDKRLKEFLENPNKIEENHNKLRQKVESKKQAKTMVKAHEEVAQKTDEELSNSSQEELDEMLNAMWAEEEINESDEDTKRVRNAQKKNNIQSQLSEEGGIIDQLEGYSEEAKQAAKQALQDSKQVAIDSQEMLDLDSEVFKNPDLIKIDKEGLSEEEMKEAVEQGLSDMREVLSAAKEQLNWEEVEATVKSMPKDLGSATPTVSVSMKDGEIVEDKEEAKPSSKDGQDSLTPINDTKPQEKEKSEEIDTTKKAEQIVDNSGINVLPTMRKGVVFQTKRLLDIVKRGQKKGLSFNDIFNALKSTDSYNSISSMLPNINNELLNFYKELTKTTPVEEKKSENNVKPEEKPAETPKTEIVETPTTPTELVVPNIPQPAPSALQGSYRPSTSQYPIQHTKGDNRKFWETVTDPVKRERYKKITEFLEKMGAFTRRDKVKPGDTIKFYIQKDFNESEPSTFTIWMTDKDGNVLGNLADESSITITDQGNLADLIKAIKKEYEEAGSPEKFTSAKYSTFVNKTLVGYMPYNNNEYHSLNEVFTTTDSNGASHSVPFTLGIIINRENGSDIYTLGGRTLSQKEKDNVSVDTRMLQGVRTGTPILLIDAGYTEKNGKVVPRRIAVPIYSKPFSENNGETFKEAVKSALTSTKDGLKIKTYLEQLFNFPRIVTGVTANGKPITSSALFVDVSGNDIKIKIKEADDTKIIYSGDINDTDAIMKSLYGFPIQINRQFINDNYRMANGKTVSYNKMMGEILNINLNPGDYTLRNNFFTTAPVSNVEKPATTEAVESSKKTETKEFDISELGLQPDERVLWNNIPTKYQEIMKGYSKRVFKRTLDTISVKGTSEEVLKEIFSSKNRIVDISKKATPFNVKKELKWLAKNLPQFTEKERLTLVEGLIKVSNDANAAYAWGQFKNGVITLSRAAARGTTYHEAFHAVFDTLLSKKEQEALYKEAQEVYKESDKLALEEKLAEDFRKYVQFRQKPLGKIVKFFDKIKNLINKIRNKPMSIESLFYRINNGEFAKGETTDLSYYNSLIRNNREERFKYENLDKESTEYLEEKSISKETYDKMTLEEKENLLYCKV